MDIAPGTPTLQSLLSAMDPLFGRLERVQRLAALGIRGAAHDPHFEYGGLSSDALQDSMLEADELIKKLQAMWQQAFDLAHGRAA